MATIIRHHTLTLIERTRLWQRQPERRAGLIANVGYWISSLRRVTDLDAEEWARIFS